MCLAARFSADHGYCDEETVTRTRATFEKIGLPVKPPTEMTASRCLELMSLDKKVRDKKLTLVLMRGIGDAFLCNTFDQQKLEKTVNSAFN